MIPPYTFPPALPAGYGWAVHEHKGGMLYEVWKGHDDGYDDDRLGAWWWEEGDVNPA